MGILAAVAIPRLSGVRANAEKKADNGSIRSIMSAISIAEADGKLDLTGKPNADAIKKAIVPNYLNEIPVSQQGTGWVVSYDASGTLTITATASGDKGSDFTDKK